MALIVYPRSRSWKSATTPCCREASRQTAMASVWWIGYVITYSKHQTLDGAPARGAMRCCRYPLPMDAAHQGGEHHLFGRGLLGGGLRTLSLSLAPGGAGVREQLVGAVQDVVDRLRVDRVQDLAERAERGRDPLRPVDDRVADHVRRLVRSDRREAVVHARRLDHRRPHEGHVDRRDRYAVVDDLRGDAAGERVQGGLRRDVGGEPRCVGL